jgi:hypothetical protein
MNCFDCPYMDECGKPWLDKKGKLVKPEECEEKKRRDEMPKEYFEK